MRVQIGLNESASVSVSVKLIDWLTKSGVPAFVQVDRCNIYLYDQSTAVLRVPAPDAEFGAKLDGREIAAHPMLKAKFSLSFTRLANPQPHTETN